MLLLVAVVLLCWIGVSFALAPLIAVALRRCDTLEKAQTLAVLRAKAQHPARHAA